MLSCSVNKSISQESEISNNKLGIYCAAKINCADTTITDGMKRRRYDDREIIPFLYKPFCFSRKNISCVCKVTRNL